MGQSTATAASDKVFSDITDNCLLTRARRISRVVTGIYDQALRPLGLSSSQFTLLVIIRRLGGASRAEIGRHNQQERSTLTRNLQLIVAAGWAEERISGGGRSRPIVLTKAGEEMLLAAAPAWHNAQTQAEALLGKPGVSAVIDLADSLAV